MLSKSGQSQVSRLMLCGLAVLLVFLFVQPLAGIAVAAATAASPATSSATTGTSPTDTYHPPLQINHSSDAAVVIETGRQRCLYDKNANIKLNIPAASKIMTALIACERQSSMTTLVTISKVAAAAADNKEPPDGVELTTGAKYPLNYLLMRLVFYNSDAAALAIAEHFANVEDKFVDLMNAKAKSLNLSNTLFKNCTGFPVYLSAAAAGTTLPATGLTSADSLQYSTPSDLARLVAYALSDTNFTAILKTQEERLLLDGKTLVSMRNAIQHIWTLSEGRITGAFYSEYSGISYMVAVGTVNDIKIVAVTAGGNPTQRMNDLESIFEGCENNYVLSPLVEAGDKFTGEQEQTVDGELFGLLYKSTVYYVHPVDDLFVKQTVRYVTLGPYSRPIQRSMTVGQVIFELNDGTSIAVDVSPDRQILSSITVLDKALNALQENRNLYIILVAASCFLLFIMAVHVLTGAGKIFRLIQLVIHEKRSRR